MAWMATKEMTPTMETARLLLPQPTAIMGSPVALLHPVESRQPLRARQVSPPRLEDEEAVADSGTAASVKDPTDFSALSVDRTMRYVAFLNTACSVSLLNAFICACSSLLFRSLSNDHSMPVE